MAFEREFEPAFRFDGGKQFSVVARGNIPQAGPIAHGIDVGPDEVGRTVHVRTGFGTDEVHFRQPQHDEVVAARAQVVVFDSVRQRAGVGDRGGLARIRSRVSGNQIGGGLHLPAAIQRKREIVLRDPVAVERREIHFKNAFRSAFRSEHVGVIIQQRVSAIVDHLRSVGNGIFIILFVQEHPGQQGIGGLFGGAHFQIVIGRQVFRSETQRQDNLVVHLVHGIAGHVHLADADGRNGFDRNGAEIIQQVEMVQPLQEIHFAQGLVLFIAAHVGDFRHLSNYVISHVQSVVNGRPHAVYRCVFR